MQYTTLVFRASTCVSPKSFPVNTYRHRTPKRRCRIPVAGHQSVLLPAPRAVTCDLVGDLLAMNPTKGANLVSF
jgi:hypothetical protein